VVKLKEKHTFFICKNRWFITITIIFLVISGILFTLWTIDQTDKQLRNDFLKIGNLAVKSIDTHGFSELTGTELDLKSLYYQRLKEQLTDMRLSDANYRFIYLAGIKTGDSVFFYLDSEPVNSKEYAFPGDLYNEPPAIIKQIFKSSLGEVEGPYTDSYGKWISVFIPVKDNSTGKILAVLGIDVDASNWSDTIIKNAGMSVGLFFIIIIMIVFVVFINRSKEQIKSQQKEIAESEKRFRVLFKDSPDAYLILKDGIIADCNTSTEVLLGADKINIIGKSTAEISPVYQPDGKKSSDTANEMILKAIKSGNITYDWVHRRFDGENFWVEVSVSPLSLEGKPELYISWRDITQRKISEEEMIELNEHLRISNEFVETSLFEKNSLIEELSATQEKLEKINSEKDKFFSIIAHDLKSPFSGFLGLTKIMAEDIQNLSMRDMQEFSKSMQDSATNLYKLLENLLEWARMKRGVTVFNPDTCMLPFMVKQVLDIQLEVAKQKQIEFINNVANDITVIADESMLNTVLRNLISNALKFTPRGGIIEVGATVQPSEDLKRSEGSAVIYVKDSGIGMSADTKSNLFKLDAKVSRPGTEDEPSTGLGLILCKEFIEKHGGKIWVESEEGKGSTFYFSLPKI
jgi:PAS domain S-box-containing protein